MNILVINWQDWENPLAGGAEIHLFEIFTKLVKKGHNIILLCSRAKKQKRYEDLNGIKVYRIGKRNNFNFLVSFALRALLRNNNVDIIIDDLNKIPFYSPFFTRKRVVVLLHHLFRSAIYRETNFIFASYVYITETLIPCFYRRAAFIAVSESTAEDLTKMGVRKHVNIVFNGVPKIPDAIREKRQENLVAYVGRVKRYKSIEHFIQAVAIIKEKRDIEVMVVGDGDARNELIALAKKLDVKVNFAGFVSEEEKYRIYSNARVIVQPSIKEGWGLTAIEAQSCGTPVVCADSPGLRDAVRESVTGYLYPYGNIDTLVSRINDLLDDSEKWKQFSNAAKEWANSFSWDRSAEKLEKILEDELDDNR